MATYSAAKAADRIMRHLCSCSRHGYTQGDDRWGTGRGGCCTVTNQGKTFKIPDGDYDCSSAVITAWRLALQPTKYKGVLDRASYTGDMKAAFVLSALFEWKSMSYIAQKGDVYLFHDSKTENGHTAMCHTAEPDVLLEFTINEKGGITGGKLGDQTGRESRKAAYYDFPWNGILRYNGKADNTSAKKKSVTTIAKEVIDGKWGNGSDRKSRIIAAGYDYAAVQKKVNELLK